MFAYKFKMTIAAVMLAVLGWSAGGCNLLEFPAYVLFGNESDRVDAEYEGLEGERVAVVVMTDSGTDFEYPYMRLNLGLTAASYIGEVVKDVSFVEQERVDRFQRDDLDWYRMSMKDIGDRFDADRVLYMDVIRFSLLEENSIGLLRGRAMVDVRVYEMGGGPAEEPAYQTELSVVYPEHAPIALSDTAELQVMQKTMELFGQQLANKFATHRQKTGY